MGGGQRTLENSQWEGGLAGQKQNLLLLSFHIHLQLQTPADPSPELAYRYSQYL
jgi:hypothetical protein